MKFNTLQVILITVTICSLCFITSIKLPQISLPKFAHHNTIGELPFIEVMDDGDFYEMDGDEDITANNCNRIIHERCEDECSHWWNKHDVMCTGRCYLKKIDYCDSLHKKQHQALLASGSYTARWISFMEQKCGSWACMGDEVQMEKYGKEWDKLMKKEWKEKDKEDKNTYWGNRGYINQ